MVVNSTQERRGKSQRIHDERIIEGFGVTYDDVVKVHLQCLPKSRRRVLLAPFELNQESRTLRGFLTYILTSYYRENITRDTVQGPSRPPLLSWYWMDGWMVASGKSEETPLSLDL